MWALVVTGIFTGAVQGPTMQMDADTIKTLVEMSGDITISQSGFSTEESCKIQLAAAPKHTLSVSGMKVTVKSVECHNLEEKPAGGGNNG